MARPHRRPALPAAHGRLTVANAGPDAAPDEPVAGELEPTTNLPITPVHEPHDRRGRPVVVRVFCSHEFFRLWLGQVVSSLGDWIGFVALVAIAARIGKSSPETAVGLVVSVRIAPGFFLAPVAGVLVDRWDRRRTMIVADVSRGLVFATVPFIDTVWGLVLASLLLEIPTLFWSPAKEASVPNLVPADRLTTANSLSLVAAYGTFPIATVLFTLLTQVAAWLSSIDALSSLEVNQETVAVYFDVVTFFVSALMISTLVLPKPRQHEHHERINFGQAFTDLREGWRFIFVSPVVRAVMVGLGTGLIGGGMLVPLGPIFASEVLGSDNGFGLLLTALGFGVAGGIAVLSATQSRLNRQQVFTWSVLIAGASLIAGAAQSSLAPAFVLVLVLGVCAGSVYIVGFTILHESVDDELRGRIFSTLYTLVRLCLLIAFAAGPLFAGILDGLSGRLFDHMITVAGIEIGLQGVRLTLWLAGAIIVGAGLLAMAALRGQHEPAPVDA